MQTPLCIHIYVNPPSRKVVSVFEYAVCCVCIPHSLTLSLGVCLLAQVVQNAHVMCFSDPVIAAISTACGGVQDNSNSEKKRTMFPPLTLM